MTTSSEIFLKIVRGARRRNELRSEAVAQMCGGWDTTRFFGGAYGSPRYLTMRRTSRAEYHFEVFL